MRVTIGLDQLTPAQWAWLNGNLPKSRIIGPDGIRMCVTIGEDRHVEMQPRDFIGLLGRLNQVEHGTVPDDIEAMIAAVFARHSQPEPAPAPATVLCRHGRPVSFETPSFVAGAKPVKVHTDGCRTFGPYPRFDW